jgi:hypothetical protein
MTAKRQVTVYTVQTVAWEYNDEYFDRDDRTFDPKLHGQADSNYLSDPVPVQSFLTRRKAEAHRRAMERERRADRNPFQYGGYGDDLTQYSTHSAQAFTERMQILGVEPPEFDRRGQCEESLWNWWAEQCQGLDDDLRNAVWDALDLVIFYQVVPMRVEVEG